MSITVSYTNPDPAISYTDVGKAKETWVLTSLKFVVIVAVS